MPVTLGVRPQHGFDNPIGLLSDCHRRIEHFLGVLLKVAQQGHGHSLSVEYRSALDVALRYFKEAAPRHTQDEEESLFPRLRQTQREDAEAALKLLEDLEADHRTAEADHELVDRLGRQWMADDYLPAEQAAELVAALLRLGTLYQRHIAVEDRQLFPVADRVLPTATLQAVGREMAARRGHK